MLGYESNTLRSRSEHGYGFLREFDASLHRETRYPLGHEVGQRYKFCQWNERKNPVKPSLSGTKNGFMSSCCKKNITLLFNPPSESHFCGAWDRCIQTVRKILTVIVKEQPLDDEGLTTLMSEVEAIVKGRLITKSSDDPLNAEALTPNHLLLLRPGPKLPPSVFTK